MNYIMLIIFCLSVIILVLSMLLFCLYYKTLLTHKDNNKPTTVVQELVFSEQESATAEDAEIWRKIAISSDHEVSNLGRARSLPRIIKSSKGSRNIAGKILTPSEDGAGFLHIKVNKKNHLLHRLIAETFFDEFDNQMFVKHKNGNIKDNRVANLELLSRKTKKEPKNIKSEIQKANNPTISKQKTVATTTTVSSMSPAEKKVWFQENRDYVLSLERRGLTRRAQTFANSMLAKSDCVNEIEEIRKIIARLAIKNKSRCSLVAVNSPDEHRLCLAINY